MQRRFALFAWSVLAFHLAVILWGAFVRASGSGAGCGEHWPLCNGQIIPSAPINSTIVEYSHRLTSGIALLSVVTLLIWAFRLFPRGSGVRFAASLALVSTLIECAIGAALVLLRLVGSTESLSRVSSYDTLGSIALRPIGLALVGPLMMVAGIRGTLLGAAGIVFAATAAVVAVPAIRRIRGDPGRFRRPG